MVLTVTTEQAINLDGAEVTQLELNGAIAEERLAELSTPN